MEPFVDMQKCDSHTAIHRTPSEAASTGDIMHDETPVTLSVTLPQSTVSILEEHVNRFGLEPGDVVQKALQAFLGRGHAARNELKRLAATENLRLDFMGHLGCEMAVIKAISTKLIRMPVDTVQADAFMKKHYPDAAIWRNHGHTLHYALKKDGMPTSKAGDGKNETKTET